MCPAVCARLGGCGEAVGRLVELPPSPPDVPLCSECFLDFFLVLPKGAWNMSYTVLATGWSTSPRKSFRQQVRGTERTAPAMPQTEPQNVSATTTVSGCRSRPSAMTLDSTTQPRELWMPNGTTTTRTASRIVFCVSKSTSGRGARIAKKAPILGMKLKTKVIRPKTATSGTCMTHKARVHARATIRLAMVLQTRYRCISAFTREEVVR
mmetsp:Transcript_38982/g.121481  ORF Transcript_38982/g.121481 Transcript_38982/m.121481 type:complete len:209 (-) Transcript_38982:855-1481(-)